VPSVIGTWGAGLPPERVHVVTVPRVGGRHQHGDLLWLRMCEALGIDPAWAPLDSDRANRSLGISETQLIRQLNRRLDRKAMREENYPALIREVLAQGGMGSGRSPAVTLPPDRFPWAEQETERWIEWIQGSGVHVVGELDDLRPVRPPDDESWRDPDRVKPKRQLDTTLDALAAMTQEAARRPVPVDSLAGKVQAFARRRHDS
jgi:hypothetical protein